MIAYKDMEDESQQFVNGGLRKHAKGSRKRQRRNNNDCRNIRCFFQLSLESPCNITDLIVRLP